MIKRRGKRTKKWDSIRRNELIPQFRAAGIMQCELRYEGCWHTNALGFAHSKKRRNLVTEHDWREVILACNPCHDILERKPEDKMGAIVRSIINQRKTPMPHTLKNNHTPLKTTTHEPVVMLSKTKAGDLDTKIHKAFNSAEGSLTDAAEALCEMRDKEGWRALGHASFKAYCGTIESKFGKKSHVYNILKQADVRRNTGATLPHRVVQEIAKLPAAKQAEIVRDGKPTVQIVKAAAKAWKKSSATKNETLGDQAEKNPKLKQALVRIGKVCGMKFRVAIENGTLDNVDAGGAIHIAGQKDAAMREAEPFISVQRFDVKKALRISGEMITEDHRIKDVVMRVIATGRFDAWFGKVHLVATRT